ncbi:glycosyltransferase [Psychroserpens sp.]|uniref:glycosyltransferase n=1 Tax=Psychroserpens sp. TaxID=2020870 RepID=UPI003C78B67E
MKNLTIISHTEHYLREDGVIVGLVSTITEINELLNIFDTITHVAMFHSDTAPLNTAAYSSNRIKFVPIPALGGPNFADKLSVLFNAPSILKTVHRSLKNANFFQFRAPTGIGVFIIPYLLFFRRKHKGWFKYAGNWKQQHAPIGYRFQRWLLTHQDKIVTINGVWEDQPKQCLSFENPCLLSEEIKNGITIRDHKNLTFPLELCFVGRIEPEKGIDLILEALGALKAHEASKISVVHFIGTSDQINSYIERAKSLAVTCRFHGMLSRSKVHAIYAKAHAILLPSKSEGFPKVIAEALNYGCLPIVANVSSIGQVITDGKNGFLLEKNSPNEVHNQLLRLLSLTSKAYRLLIHNNHVSPEIFSYYHYNKRLMRCVMNN